MYRRVLEACHATARRDFGVSCRQYGWSGEQASGFLRVRPARQRLQNRGRRPGTSCWAGHVIMATASPDVMGLDGDRGTIEAEFTPDGMNVTPRDGQRALRVRDGQVLPAGLIWVVHDRIPFAVELGDVCSDSAMAAGAALTDFQTRFNRLTLRVTGLKGSVGHVTWGGKSKDFTASALASGINLTAEFPENPTVPPSPPRPSEARS